MCHCAMEQRRKEDLEEEFGRVERGWYLGDDEFKQELLEQVSTKSGIRHYGEMVREAAETRAEVLVRLQGRTLVFSDWRDY